MGKRHNKSGSVVWEKSIQGKPFFESHVISHKDNLVIDTLYSDSMNFINGKPNVTDIDVMGFKGKVTRSFSISDKGDTGNVRMVAYRPIGDTNIPFRGFGENIGSKFGDIGKEVSYYNNLQQIERVDFYDNDRIEERETFKYNEQKQIMVERYFSFPKSRYVSQTTYLYNRSGELTEKKVDNFDDGLTKRYEYRNGRLVREEYIFNGKLDHALIYKYEAR
jgi:antitoxin component YwqK of YwqJK toxin-antitoxin module